MTDEKLESLEREITNIDGSKIHDSRCFSIDHNGCNCDCVYGIAWTFLKEIRIQKIQKKVLQDELDALNERIQALVNKLLKANSETEELLDPVWPA